MALAADASSQFDDGVGEQNTHSPCPASVALVQKGVHLEVVGAKASETAQEKASRLFAGE
jgi:hypothetical protein